MVSSRPDSVCDENASALASRISTNRDMCVPLMLWASRTFMSNVATEWLMAPLSVRTLIG